MAWRIEKHVIRGEIDNRVKGRVTGRLWLAGMDEPRVLDLQGNTWRDLAGHVLRFVNPRPVKPLDSMDLTPQQIGFVGDISASRKVRLPTCTDEELTEHIAASTAFPWAWGNSLYLEWFSETNGRVVIEAAHFQLDLDPDRTWEMTEQEEDEQRRANAETLSQFVARLTRSFAEDDVEDDEATSVAEAQADAEAARMDLLIDRVNARLAREGGMADFDRIFDEERERLRRERGEPEPPELTSEEEAERIAWIEEMNAIASEALEDPDGDHWKEDLEPHPLVTSCSDLGIRMSQEVKEGGWLDERASEEHPLRMAIFGVQSAAAKLAGALGIYRDDEWPPDALFAGDTLVRLKKARAYLRDAIAGLDGADEEHLATASWRTAARNEIENILSQVQHLIGEVRGVLEEE